MHDNEALDLRERLAASDPLLTNSEIEWFERVVAELAAPRSTPPAREQRRSR